MAKTTSSVNYLTARRPHTGNPIVADKTDPITGIVTPAITYDSLGRVVSVVYQVGQVSSATEVITFSYNESGSVVFKGIAYKNHYINLWEATLVPTSQAALDAACAARTSAELQTIEVLGLTTANIVTTNDDHNIITTNDGELIFTPTIS